MQTICSDCNAVLTLDPANGEVTANRHVTDKGKGKVGDLFVEDDILYWECPICEYSDSHEA